MVKEKDENLDLLEDIERSPRLTNYIMRNKATEVKKTAAIVGLIACIVAFIAGFMVGVNIFNITQTKSIVEVQVSKD